MDARVETFGRIGVLMGGTSSERDISFKSGKAILAALLESGCDAKAVEINSDQEEEIIGCLKKEKIDIAFIALHGEFGEDGTLQALLEKNGIVYTGSGPQASRLAMHKARTQELLKQQGIPVAPFTVIRRGEKIHPQEVLLRFQGRPVVVKPACEGSSIGITIVRESQALPQAVETAFSYGDEILLEQCVPGRELTAGVLDGRALPLVEIRPQSPFFDFTAKYQQGLTEYTVPAKLDKQLTHRIQAAAVKTYNTVACRDFARIDFMLDEQQFYVLEINTIPGFTATSLLPMAAKESGMTFAQLCLAIVRMAAQRRSRECV